MQQRMIHQFGAQPGVQHKERYSQSEHWKDGKFHNLEFTTMDIKASKIPGLMYRQFLPKRVGYQGNRGQLMDGHRLWMYIKMIK